MLTTEKLKTIIAQQKVMAPDDVKKAMAEAEAKHVSLEQHLIGDNVVGEKQLYEAVAAAFKVPFLDIGNETIRKDILMTIPESIVQAHQILAFDRTNEYLKIATTNPDDLQTFEFLQKKTGLPVRVHVTTPTAIRDMIRLYHKELKAKVREITSNQQQVDADKQDLKKMATDVPVIRIVDTILEYAIFEGASDIHIEPTEKDVIVRYRVDGVLREVMTLPNNVQTGIVARIKILSNLKIDEHRLPQDGRFKVETDEYKVAFRVSILPVYDGEKIVLRLLNESAQVLTLEQIGLNPSALEIVKRQIRKPHGILLVTGPTGSGKTTTLYTMINILNKPGVNISTVEDPIEYRMPRVNQSQVNPKINFTFAVGLRSLLRQDPDIVMVGEIRDNETAEIAAHAAMTGHLVLSTLHTNDAVGAFPRLHEMSVPSFLVATTMNLIIAQRLVRKICRNCLTSYTLSKRALEELEKEIDLEHILSTLEQEGVVQMTETKKNDLLFFRGKGCKQCNGEGYKGRIGIYEVLENTREISDLILNQGSSNQLRDQARRQGMLTLLEDGFIKAKQGITTIEEILRVTKE